MSHLSVRVIPAVLAALLVMVGCGGSSVKPPTGTQPTPAGPVDNLPDADPWDPKAPTLIAVAPGQMAVGDELTILGEDFVPAGKGRPLIKIAGTYFDDGGQTYPVELQVYGKRKSRTKLSWRLWPNIVFHPSGDRLGSFVGEVQVINTTNDGAQLPSVGYPVRIDLKPSLIARMARPNESECQNVVDGTVESTGMTFSVDALGLRPGTKEEPLTFQWTFLQKHWKVRFAHDSMDVESNIPKQGAVMLEDKVDEGLSSTLYGGSNQRSFLVKAASDVYDNLPILGQKRLTEISTMPVPEAGNSYEASVQVIAIDGSGKTATISIPLTISRSADLIYDGSLKIAERLPPKQVTDCMPGGDIGRHVSYREDKGESHQRTMSTQYNANAAVSSGWPPNPFALGINFSVGFGRDVSATVSTQHNQGLDLTGQILPGEYGTFYRQVTKVIRVGQIVGINKCGQRQTLGQAMLTDFIFTPDLATGTSCPPATRLQPAQKFM